MSDRSMIDALKARVSVETVLTAAGAVFQHTSFTQEEAPFYCPFCDDVGSTKPAGRANDLEGLWHCWACNRGGDIFTAVQAWKSVGFDEALQYLLDTYPREEANFDPWADRQGAS